MNDNQIQDNYRQELISKGSLIIKEELNEQVGFVDGLQREVALKNTDVISHRLAVNKNLSRAVKARVKEFSDNMQRYILAIAYKVEEQIYDGVAEKIGEMELMKYNEERVFSVIDAQRKLSGSFQTLTVVIDIFREINNQILYEIENADRDGLGRGDETKLYFRNVLLVYELTNFTVRYLERFGLAGLDDLQKIRDDVFADLARGDAKDREMERSPSQNERLRASILKDIANRREVRLKVREKWEKMMGEVGEIKKKSESTKLFLKDIKMIRDNAEQQLDILSQIAITQLTNSSIQAVAALDDVSNFKIAPLDGKKAVELLGLEVKI